MVVCMDTHFLEVDHDSVDEHKATFLKVLKNILDDDSFKITSPTTTEARKVAVGLLEWCTTDINKQHFDTFIKTLFNSLQKPLMLSSRQSCNQRNYFLVHSPKEFITNWITFLNDANLTATSIFISI